MKSTLTPIAFESSSPLYAQLHALFRSKIVNGELKPRETLPSEVELASLYGVSLITVRRALSELVLEGHIERKAGKGTTVVPRLLGLSRLLEAQGHTTSTTILAMGPVEPAVAIALSRQLGLSPDPSRRLHRIRRLRYVDGRPAALVDNYVDAELGSQLDKDKIRDASLYQIIEDSTGAAVTRIEVDMRPIVADQELAKHLHVEVGSPHHQWITTSFLPRDRPILYGIGTYSADVFKWQTTLLGMRDGVYSTQDSRWRILPSATETVDREPDQHQTAETE